MTVYRITTHNRYVGLAADTKPSGVPIGSRFLAADTPAEFIYVGLYYATGSLPVTDQPEAGDTIAIGCTTYTFVDDCMAACAGDVEVGSSIAEAVANIVAAINGTDGVNTANEDVSAAADGTTVVLTALETGEAANMISTTYTPDCCSCAMNAFDDCTLLGGQDEWQALA